MTMRDVYLFLGIFGTVLLALQFVLSFFSSGGDAVDGEGDFSAVDHDVADLHGLNIFSLKSIVSFVTFFGWGGFFFGDGNAAAGVAIAVICGAAMMFLTALIISLMLKMQQSGNLDVETLPGRRGSVYLKVPGGRSAGGVVTVVLPGCTRQFPARSDEELPTGSDVTVKAVLGGNVLLVEKLAVEETHASDNRE